MARPVIAKQPGRNQSCSSSARRRIGSWLHRQGQRPKALRARLHKLIAPNVQIIAPWRSGISISREDAIAYAEKHSVPIEQSKKNIYSRDRNIWHLSHEGAELEDPANAPNETMWQWVVSPDKAPDKAEEVEIGLKPARRCR